MTKTEVLKRLIKESGIRKEKIAALLGISITSLNNKITNRTSFYADELYHLKALLNLSQAQFFDIFFASEVSDTDTRVERA